MSNRHASSCTATSVPNTPAAPGLLAWVAVSKYTDHLPLYRIEQIGARQGVPLARSTLAEWIGKVGVALQPLSERLAELLRQRPCLHADETPVRQLDPGQGKTRHAYLWAYRSNNFDEGRPIVVFDYQTGRAGAHARAFLLGWQGQLMVDDYSGYKAMFATGITELACLAHVRRKFFDLHAANGSPIAAEALRRVGLLYAVKYSSRNKREVLANRTGCGARRPLRRSAGTASGGQRRNAPVMAAKNHIYLLAGT